MDGSNTTTSTTGIAPVEISQNGETFHVNLRDSVLSVFAVKRSISFETTVDPSFDLVGLRSMLSQHHTLRFKFEQEKEQQYLLLTVGFVPFRLTKVLLDQKDLRIRSLEVQIETLQREVAELKELASPKWTPLNINMGTLPNGGEVSFRVGEAVPSSAKSILVYAQFHSGHAGPDRLHQFTFWTQEGTTKWSALLHAHSYAQNAWSYNSDHFWLPLTSDRTVHCSCDGGYNGNIGGSLTLLGYK